MNEISSTRKSPVIFFILVFTLSSLFWMVGALTGLQLLPGVPVSAFSSFCPMIAALILVYRENKSSGMARLLKRSIDYKRIKAKVWLAPTILFWPGVMVLSYGVMR